MGVAEFTEELTSPISAKRMFKAFTNSDNLLLKLKPEVFKSVEIIKGDRGAGTIKKVTYIEDGKVKYLVHRIDAFDKEKMEYCYTITEGDHDLMNKIESVSHEYKLQATPDGGCKVTNNFKYYLKPGAEIKEEEMAVMRKRNIAIKETVEAYLMANPNACA